MEGLNIMINKEYILCSAIWFNDGNVYNHQPKNIKVGFVIAGRRHHNCFNTLAITTNRNNKYLKFEKEQGFITNKDRFVDRIKAAEIAYKAGQIDQPKNKLFSEDIY